MRDLTEERSPAQGLALSRLWRGTRASRRGPRPKLSLTEIVDAALGVARAEGLSAVTMARVSEAAGCAKMALYRHVSDRGDLLSAMLDSALGEPPEPTGSWRDQFATLWDSLLDLYARDAWLLELPADVNGLTPRNVAWIDASLGLLDGSTVPADQRLSTVLLITENIRFEARRRRSEDGRADDLDGLFSSAMRASGHLPAERFPHLVALSRGGGSGLRAPSTSMDHVRELMLRSIAGYFPGEDAR